jgi:repressor LexA
MDLQPQTEPHFEPMGAKLRRQRRRLGLTLDELAGRTGISKPYLSLIETGRVPNPPSDEKLTKLEQTLGFKTGELLTQAHLHRTPRDVRAMLSKLLAEGAANAEANSIANGLTNGQANGSSAVSLVETKSKRSKSKSGEIATSVPLDDLYLSGMLRQFVDRSAGNVEMIPTNAVPVINRVSAGYPKDFTDLNYPRGVADTYLSCPDVSDPDAFAARVFGDSMVPKYREGDIVIFSPKAAVKNGDDAFIRFADGNETTFKRVFYENDEKGNGIIRLQPRNEKYAPQIVSSEKLSGVWRAVFKYQSVDDAG